VSRLVEIDPISTDMALRVRPREVSPVLETDIYVALDNPGLPAFERAARAILENPDADVTPFDEASDEQLLSGAAGTLDRQARYSPREPDFELGTAPPPTDALTVTNTWVVFARRKGTNFLIEDIRRLPAAVEAGPVPEGAPRFSSKIQKEQLEQSVLKITTEITNLNKGRFAARFTAAGVLLTSFITALVQLMASWPTGRTGRSILLRLPCTICGPRHWPRTF
jgi:hypothetical protein